MWAELFCLGFYVPDGGRWDRSEARGWTSDLIRQAAPPLPRFPATRVAPSPPHMRGRGGTPWGSSASQPPVEFRPDPPWVVGVGAGSGRVPAPKLAAGTAASATLPDFWVTGRPRSPLNASVATVCAAGVISMHQTPPGMVRGVSGVSRGRFVTISTGSHSGESAAHEPPKYMPTQFDTRDPLQTPNLSARAAEIAFCGPPCTQITQVNPHRDEKSTTARLFVDVLDVLDRTRHSMCFFESPASVMTADGGRLYASFQDKCTHVGYVVHTLEMNARHSTEASKTDTACSSVWYDLTSTTSWDQ
jgi:hypothetical protein